MVPSRKITVGVVLVGILGLTGCVTGSDGFAADLAERTAIAMADDIAPAHSPEPLSGEHLAWLATTSPRLPDDPDVDYTIDAYSWSGNSGDELGGQFSVRIDVQVADLNDSGFVPGRQAGHAVRCYAFVVRAIPEWQGAVSRQGVDCPEGALPPPEPDDLLVMPDDAEARIATVLAVATAADVEELLREQFPDEGYAITSREQDGELVVSVFIAREPSCRIGVRTAEGDITTYGVPSSDLLPGEGNCDVRIYSP